MKVERLEGLQGWYVISGDKWCRAVNSEYIKKKTKCINKEFGSLDQKLIKAIGKEE